VVESESLFAKCKSCGKAVSKSVNACPHCGAKQARISGMQLTIAIIFGLIILGMIASPDQPKNSTSTSSSVTSSKSSVTQEPPPLELVSWRCEKEYGFIHVRGEVRNVSPRKLENVAAVGEFRTKDGELVKSEVALLEYNPIMPMQTSPFSAGGTDNPSIKRCGVTFKYLFGGSIDFTQKEKKTN